jgi:alpha-1,3-rhamnosyl/mannosyltransferase
VRVLIDTTYAQRAPHSGTAVYLERLSDALGRLPEVELVTVHNPRRRPASGGGLGSIRNLIADQRWVEVELPRHAREAGAELIHHPLPAHAQRAGVPQVVTVHDLAFERLPELFDPRFRRYAHLAHRAAARGASAVICVSETTAADVRELWDVPAERVVVAPHGPGQELPARDRGRPEHLLYVGDGEPRKDLPTLIEAYRRYRDGAQAPLDLILAGSAGADDPGIRTEQPTADRLAELHAGAAALVHTSRYEGFGLTPLEALVAGTPVIAADAPGVREVCGDAARYCEPGDAAAFAAAITEIASTPAIGQALADRGRARSANFSWAASAHAHRDAYSVVLRA